MKHMSKMIKKSLWVLVALLVLQACYPGGAIPIADLDTTSTFYNTEDLATSPNSAAIVWDVVEVIDEDDPDNNIPYNGEVDDEILNTTLLELIDLYGVANVVIISETATPSPAPINANVSVFIPADGGTPPPVDVVITPSVLLRIKVVGTVYPGYPWWGGGWWGGWYPGYYPPGGCYYCGYPPTVSYTQYQTGTVILDLFDLRQFAGGGTVPNEPSWVAVMRGLLSSNSSSNSDRVVSNIKQAFAQSPYLKP